MSQKVEVTVTEIKGEASFTKISLEAALQKARANIAYADPKAEIAFVHLDAEASYQLLHGVVSWADIQATGVYLDPDTKNRFFDDSLALADQIALTTEKGPLDQFGLTDELVFDVTVALSDTVAFTENVEIVLTIQRNFSETVSLADVAVLTLDRPVSDSMSVTDSPALSVDKPASDSFSFVDAVARDFTKSLLDGRQFGNQTTSFFVLDDLSRTVTYHRTFSDAFTLDDSTTVSGPNKTVTTDKGNVFGLTDTHTFSLTKNASDSVSMGDTITIELISGSSAVLNVSALNTYTLNS